MLVDSAAELPSKNGVSAETKKTEPSVLMKTIGTSVLRGMKRLIAVATKANTGVANTMPAKTRVLAAVLQAS